jgi:hypothetical protein
MTESYAVKRRAAVVALARKYGKAPKDVYAAIERTKKSAI